MAATGLQKQLNTVSLEQLFINSTIHNSLRRRGVHSLGDILAFMHQTIFHTPGLPLSFVFQLRDELHAQGYLLYRQGNRVVAPNRAARLTWLARTQNEVGCWCPEGSGSAATSMPEFNFTIGATLSFIRAGHTATTGKYASVVARAMRWLEQDHPLPNETLAYGLCRVLAEHYDMPIPRAPFQVPERSALKTFDQIRQWALVYGNAPVYPWRFQNWSDSSSLYGEDADNGPLFPISHSVQMAWMTVGTPIAEKMPQTA